MRMKMKMKMRWRRNDKDNYRSIFLRLSLFTSVYLKASRFSTRTPKRFSCIDIV